MATIRLDFSFFNYWLEGVQIQVKGKKYPLLHHNLASCILVYNGLVRIPHRLYPGLTHTSIESYEPAPAFP